MLEEASNIWPLYRLFSDYAWRDAGKRARDSTVGHFGYLRQIDGALTSYLVPACQFVLWLDISELLHISRQTKNDVLAFRVGPVKLCHRDTSRNSQLTFK